VGDQSIVLLVENGLKTFIDLTSLDPSAETSLEEMVRRSERLGDMAATL
jgi:hypothetical protein